MTYAQLLKKFGNKRYEGNILTIKDQLPSKFYHSAITSPPFWKQRNYGHKDQIGQEKTPELYIENIVKASEVVKHTLRDDGLYWLNLGDKVIKKNQLLLPHRVAIELQKNGWLCLDTIIWHKTSALPSSVKGRTSLNYEYVFCLAKSENYFYDKVAIEVPAKTQSKDPSDPLLYRTRPSVWSIPTASHKDRNGSTFPEDLIEPMILASTSSNGVCSVCGDNYKRVSYDSGKRRTMEIYKGESQKDYESLKAQNPSDTKRRILERQSIVWHHRWEKSCNCSDSIILPAIVFDPFIGSGTTSDVCNKLKRKWAGVDLIKGEDAKEFYK